jgi:hypothetical protein
MVLRQIRWQINGVFLLRGRTYRDSYQTLIFDAILLQWKLFAAPRCHYILNWNINRPSLKTNRKQWKNQGYHRRTKTQPLERLPHVYVYVHVHAYAYEYVYAYLCLYLYLYLQCLSIPMSMSTSTSTSASFFISKYTCLSTRTCLCMYMCIYCICMFMLQMLVCLYSTWRHVQVPSRGEIPLQLGYLLETETPPRVVGTHKFWTMEAQVLQ